MPAREASEPERSGAAALRGLATRLEGSARAPLYVDLPDRRCDPRDPEALRPDRFSVAVHEVLAAVARRHPLGERRALVGADVVSEVMRRLVTRSPALRLRLRRALWTYLVRFAPPDAAVQVTRVDRCFDLVWELGRAVWADEIKCGSFVGVSLADQVDREIAVGHQAWGDAFTGVRVVSLGAPSAAVFCALRRVPLGLPVDAVIDWESSACRC